MTNLLRDFSSWRTTSYTEAEGTASAAEKVPMRRIAVPFRRIVAQTARSCLDSHGKAPRHNAEVPQHRDMHQRCVINLWMKKCVIRRDGTADV
jgi:hypothetical protein